jgi:hypothetical protein
MLIYVMGRPHSGSTILDILIGNSSSVESVGELVSGLRAEPRGHVCACGAPMAGCPYWQTVKQHFATASAAEWSQAAKALATHANIRNLPRTLFAGPRSPAVVSLAALNGAFTTAIATTSGKPHVLDSSKEPTRGLFLLRFVPNAHVLHLVRDPRRAIASHYWRFKKDRGYFHFLRRKFHAPAMLVPFMLLAAASWTLGNMICELATRFRPTCTLRVRYEDLCDDPSSELRRIGAAFGLSFEEVISRIEHGDDLAIGHNVGGNEIRRGGMVTFRPARGRQHDLPVWLDLVTLACCWPLMLFYGYRLRPTGAPHVVTSGLG